MADRAKDRLLPGCQRDGDGKDVAFNWKSCLFLGNHIWQPGLARNKHKHDDFQQELRSLETLRKVDLTKMLEDFGVKEIGFAHIKEDYKKRM